MTPKLSGTSIVYVIGGLLFALLSGYKPNSAFAQEQAAAFQLKKAQEGWQRLRAAIDGLKLSYTETTTLANASKPPITIKHDFCIQLEKGYARNVRQRQDRPDLTDVELENPNYAFRVRQHEPNAPYSMTFYDGVSPGAGGRMDSQQTRFNLGYLITGYYMEPFTLFEICSAPEFTLDSSKVVELAGLKCVEVEWTWKPELLPNGTKWTAILSPAEDWAIRKCSMFHPDGDTHITATYQKTAQGYLVPKEIIEEQRIHNGATSSTKVVKFDAPSECLANPNDFTATAYGLPEPGSGFSRTFIGGVALSFIALLVLVFYRKK